jgi:hypothetical protein
MDFIDERAWWLTKVLDDHDIPLKADIFDQAQNVERQLCGFKFKHCMALDMTL